MKISKTAGARLKPHAARLIPALLEALSSLESQILNYLSLRATEQEKVSSAKPGNQFISLSQAGLHVTHEFCLRRAPWMPPG